MILTIFVVSPMQALGRDPATKPSGLSETEFLREMLSHKSGLTYLCGQILGSFPELTASGNYSSYLSDRCRLHDDSKVNQSAEFVRAHRIDPNESLAKQLGSLYGQGAPQNHPAIVKINAIDDAIAEALAKKYNVPLDIQKSADQFEHVVDIIARYSHEQAFPHKDGMLEFGRPLVPTSEWLNRPMYREKFDEKTLEKLKKIAKNFETPETINKYKEHVLSEGPRIDRELGRVINSSIYQARVLVGVKKSTNPCLDQALERLIDEAKSH
jgi:hypothetical protein